MFSIHFGDIDKYETQAKKVCFVRLDTLLIIIIKK